MAILEFSDGAVVSESRVSPVTRLKVEFTTGVNRVNLPEHAIFVFHDEANVSGHWNGSKPLREHWNAGDASFLPRRSDIAGSVTGTSVHSIIRIDDAVFENVAPGSSSSLAAIEFQHLSNPTISYLSIAISYLTSTRLNCEWPLLVEATARQLAEEVVKQLLGLELTEPGNNKLSADRRRRVVEFVENNLSEPITLAALAAAAAMSPHHFARRWKEATGISPVRYVWRRRVEMAKRLMGNGGIPIVEVAMACGFTSHSHFTTIFKRLYGCTPSQYQRDSSCCT